MEIQTEDRLEFCVTMEALQLQFLLINDDLLLQKTEVIVNAANGMLQLGGGVAGAINLSAGPSVQRECDLIMKGKNNRKLQNGEVEETGKGNLRNQNLKKIFHAVGPVYFDGKRNEKEDLIKTFKNILNKANELKYKSISIKIFNKHYCCLIYFL